MKLFNCCLIFYSCSLVFVSAKYVPMPDIPFHVVWQVPSGPECQVPWIDVTLVNILNNSGIVFNQEDKFEGEFSTIIYRGEFGYWPHYLDGKEPPINGGMPQLGNLTAHLLRAREAINNAIPNADFHGVACINMEQFRPLWERNWGDKRVYQIKSREIVRAQYANVIPFPTSEWIEEEAIRQFSYYSKKYMVDSLRLAREMRPNGKWGYYHFPYCFNEQPVTLHCRDTVKYGNDKTRWLWEESTAILPSIYVYDSSRSYYDTGRYMYANIEEGIRVAESVGGRPVYVYHKIMWNQTIPVLWYPQVIMFLGMRLSADFGAEGVILWGSQVHYKTKFDCERAYRYSKETIIPYAKSLVEFTILCSNQLCSGRGRCRHRGTLEEKYVDEVLRTTIPQLIDWTIDERYRCQCYKNFSGHDCSVSVDSGQHVKLSLTLLIVSFLITMLNC